MHNRSARLRVARVVLLVLFLGVTSVLGAGRADAAPWGASGADYDGVLCRLGANTVPMGAWTVNGTVRAFSLEDVVGMDASQPPAPISGTPSTMFAGQAGFSSADIGAVAYLLAGGQGGAARSAEISAEVAIVAGSGRSQSRCLGQNGTSARRAAGRLGDARRHAGPYTVQVDAQSGVIPGADADIAVTVRSASGAATPGIAVSLDAGGSVVSLVTGDGGVARTTIGVPAAASTPIKATATVPTGLVYIDTSPPSVTLGPLTTVVGAAALRPVLKPTPAVSIGATELVLSGASTRPVADVTGTFGYSGTGEVILRGPVRAAGDEPCSSVPAAAIDRAAVRWQEGFTFRGDAQYRAQPTPGLAPGCYGLRATVTTTNSTPPVRAGSSLVPLTVASLKLASAASARAVAPGGLAATVTAADPGRATVTTTVQARGPLPVRDAGCRGDFAAAPVAGRSTATSLRRSGDRLQATVRIPDVRAAGCYALVSSSEVTLDGRSATAAGGVAATTAILRPGIVVTTDAISGQQGTPMPGAVQVSGTFGFPGVVAIGVVEGTTIPISGCRDSLFSSERKPVGGTKVATTADASYAFRSPAPPRNACYSVTATFTLAANPAVTATSGAPDDATVFLAGVRPDRDTGSVVQKTDGQGVVRAVVTYAIAALLILAGAVALFVRTFHRERERGPGVPLFRWRPNRGDDAHTDLLDRPRPGDGARSRPLPSPGPR